MVRTGRDALYLGRDSLLAVPRAYVVQAVVSIGQAMLMLKFLRRVGVRRMRLLALASAVVLGIVYAAVAEPGGAWPMTLLFVGVPTVFSICLSLSWTLAAEAIGALGEAGAPRRFAFVGAASILGGASGGVAARALGPALGERALLFSGTLVIVGALTATVRAHRTLREGRLDTPRHPPTSVPDWTKVPGLALLAGVAMAGAASGIFVDFQFYLGAASRPPGDRVAYFAGVYLLLHIVALLLQLLATPWLTRRLRCGRALLVLPAALAAGGAAALVAATPISRALLRVLEGGLKRGVHQSSWEQTLAGVPSTSRTAIKILVEGGATRVAEGIAGLALLLVIHGTARAAYARDDLTGLGMGWTGEASAVIVGFALVLTTSLAVVLTILLARRLGPCGQARDIGAASAFAPVGCCPVTLIASQERSHAAS
jgi:hypothetical protein